MTKFEEYLYTKFEDDQPGFLDDDLPDAFNAWLSNLQADDFIKYGDELLETLNK